MQDMLHTHRPSHITDLALSLLSSFSILSRRLTPSEQRGVVIQDCAPSEVRACVRQAANGTASFA
jgi:hypothetical protein